jgi:hypothetical protein
MPPFAQPTGLARTEDLKTHSGFGNCLPCIFSLLIFATLFWSVKSCLLWKSRTMSRAASPQDKGPVRQDSPAMDMEVENKGTTPRHKNWEKVHRLRLDSLGQEIDGHTSKPIFPWVLPPQALPGPYDPPYYPLPAPTIRRHSTDASNTPAEESGAVSYFRRTSTAGIPPRDTALYATTTTSTQGWRRTQWIVTGG